MIFGWIYEGTLEVRHQGGQRKKMEATKMEVSRSLPRCVRETLCMRRVKLSLIQEGTNNY